MSTLLLVDDEEKVLNSLIRLFRKDNYKILTALSGTDGLEVLSNNKVDLILSDYMMPGMKGVEFLSESKKITPDSIRIMLTGFADLQATMDAINKGEVYRFMTKPWDDDDLRLTIRQSLDYRNLYMENRRLADTVRKQNSLIEDLEKKHPGISDVATDGHGVLVIDEDDLEDLEKDLLYDSKNR